jgi:phosphatidate cytidylyltransferase
VSNPDPEPQGGGTLLARAQYAGLVILAFAALAWADAVGLGGVAPAWWLLPLAAAMAVGGSDEFTRLLAARGVILPGWLLRPAAVAIVVAAAAGAEAFAASLSRASPTAALGWSAAALALSILPLFLVEIARYDPGEAGAARGRALERLAAGVLGLVLVPLPLAFMVSLRLLCAENLGPEQRGPGHLGMLPLVSLVAVAKAGDVAAYLGGTLFGRRRMAPVLSPGKTWEGAAASLVGAIAAAWFVVGRLGGGLPVRPWGGWLAFGLLVGLAAILGDLAESLVKRECGAKDSGRTLGGLGGVLDLIDSFVFSAPVAWLLWVAGGR